MRPPRVSHDFQRTVTDSVPDCPLVKSNCLLRGERGPNEVASNIQYSTSERPSKIAVSAGQRAFSCR